MTPDTEVIENLVGRQYPYGFVTPLDTDVAPRGISEGVIRLISSKKDEPQWLLDWRLATSHALKKW